MYILPEAKQLATEYMIIEEEANEFVKMGLPYDTCAKLCGLLAAHEPYELVRFAAECARQDYFGHLHEKWNKAMDGMNDEG